MCSHDNGGHDKYIAITNNNIVIGVHGGYITIGNDTGTHNKQADYKNKANASSLLKWICLSAHWNKRAGNNGSSVYCNGQKLASFAVQKSVGSNKLTVGDIKSSDYAPFHGDIGLF